MTAPDPFGGIVEAIVTVVVRRLVDELRPLITANAPAAAAPLLDKRGLANALTVSDATVNRMTAEGMPHIFVGASPRYALDEVRAWLDTRGRQGTKTKTSKASIAGVRLLSRGGK